MKTNTYDEMQMQPTGRTITLQLFELHELSEEAQERAYGEWVRNYRDSVDYLYDTECGDVIRYGEKALASVGINAEWDSWENCFPGNYADPCSERYLPYVNAAEYLPNATNICHMDDQGYWSSISMANAFNAYEAELIELVKAYEREADDAKAGAIADKFSHLHYEACYDACKVFQNCYEEEKESLESFEHFEDESEQGSEWRTIDKSGRVYYSDYRKWYTIDGELYEQSNINYECVSIVKR